jgi:hypothetical protein
MAAKFHLQIESMVFFLVLGKRTHNPQLQQYKMELDVIQIHPNVKHEP